MWVEQNAGDVDLRQFDATDLANYLHNALFSYYTAHPYRSPQASGDIFASSVVLASFDPETATSYVRSLELKISPDLKQLLINDVTHAKFGPDDVSEPLVFGEVDYLMTEVLPTFASQPSAETTKSLIGNFPHTSFMKTAETPKQTAIDLAKDLIGAASRMTATKPASSGIGGPIDIRFIGAEPRVERVH